MRRQIAYTGGALAAVALSGCTIPAPGPPALSRVAVAASPATGEAIASVPGCPDWSRSSREDFSNRVASNFGCADALNFVAQLADPRDALRGRGTGAQDAGVAASAVSRYRAGKVTPLKAGGSAASATPGGGSGAE